MSYVYSKLYFLFKDGLPQRNTESAVDGSLFNGQPVQLSKKADIPSVEITDSPSSLQRRACLSTSMGSLSGLSEDSHSLDEHEGRVSSSSSTKGESRSQMKEVGEKVAASPSRKSTEALKKVLINAVS